MTNAFQKSRERVEEGFKSGRISKRQHARQMMMIDREEERALRKAVRDAEARLAAFTKAKERERSREQLARDLRRSLHRLREIELAQ